MDNGPFIDDEHDHLIYSSYLKIVFFILTSSYVTLW